VAIGVSAPPSVGRRILRQFSGNFQRDIESGLDRGDHAAAHLVGGASIAITLTAENYHRHQREGQPGFSAQMREQGHTSRQEILEVATVPAPTEIAERLGIEEGADVVMRWLRFLVDDKPVQLVKVYYEPRLVAGSRLERPVMIPDGVHAELRRLGVQMTRFVEDFTGARLPDPDEERALQLQVACQ